MVGEVEAVEEAARQGKDHLLGEDEEENEEPLPSVRVYSNLVSATALIEARHAIG